MPEIVTREIVLCIAIFGAVLTDSPRRSAPVPLVIGLEAETYLFQRGDVSFLKPRVQPQHHSDVKGTSDRKSHLSESSIRLGKSYTRAKVIIPPPESPVRGTRIQGARLRRTDVSRTSVGALFHWLAVET